MPDKPSALPKSKQRAPISLPSLPGKPPSPDDRHPIASGMTREARHDVFDLDPKRIEVEGFYVREEDESDEDFDAFVRAVEERGEIDVPLSVRTVGPPTTLRYILVWGRRRLRAARHLGLKRVLVRNYGAISETEAIKLQLAENLTRREMTPAETALAFWQLASRGLANREIATQYARNEGYVSYMVRTGEALATFSPNQRRALNQSGYLRVRDCQELAKFSTVKERATHLHALFAARAQDNASHDEPETAVGSGREGQTLTGKGRQPRTRRPDEERPFQSRSLRRGRSFRVRWVEHDLRNHPERFVSDLTNFLREEVIQIVARLDALRAEFQRVNADPELIAEIDRAREAAFAHAPWLRSELVSR